MGDVVILCIHLLSADAAGVGDVVVLCIHLLPGSGAPRVTLFPNSTKSRVGAGFFTIRHPRLRLSDLGNILSNRFNEVPDDDRWRKDGLRPPSMNSSQLYHLSFHEFL